MVNYITTSGHKPLEENSLSSKNRKNNKMELSKRGGATKIRNDDQVNMQNVHIEFTTKKWMHEKYIKIMFNLGGCVQGHI